MTNAYIKLQVGYPESWLCSIFTNLTDDLAAALRDAWLACMILRRQATRLAERSACNRMRRALVAADDEAEVTILTLVYHYYALHCDGATLPDCGFVLQAEGKCFGTESVE